MFRFTDQVRGGEFVRDIKQKYPETEPVFERFGLRPACYDCSIDQAARKVGVAVGNLLQEVNEVIHRRRFESQ
ncbi:MAG: hypothetical protein LAN62_04480 [Acidobacteriia bacterium]|nr:hypothetical protein [Terriglobia bacterium]